MLAVSAEERAIFFLLLQPASLNPKSIYIDEKYTIPTRVLEFN